MNRIIITIGLCASMCFACSDDDPSGAGTDTATGTETDEAPDGRWTIYEIDDENMGLQARMAVDAEGVVSVAYFSDDAFVDGVCDELVFDEPPPKRRHTLRYARSENLGKDWVLETVDEPVYSYGAQGLSIRIDPQGNPAISFTGGEPEDRYCGGNDAMFATRTNSGWEIETAAQMSNDFASGVGGSDDGYVVGMHPGLAFDCNGQPAIVHRDAHFGGIQHDDIMRADAEFAWRKGGNWTYEAIDLNEGAGYHNELVFDEEDRPIAVYAITREHQKRSRQGVWASRREADGKWVRVQLYTGPIHQEISAKFNPVTGALGVAFYSAWDYAAQVMTLSDPDKFEDTDGWTKQLVGSRGYDEGRHVTLDYTPEGNIALAYHRCREHVDNPESGCDANDEAVIFATKRDGQWKYERVKKAEIGSCGGETTMSIAPDGNAYIFFTCTKKKAAGFTSGPLVATKSVS